MSFTRTILVLAALSFAATAHPMGNFSVNHYSRLYFHQSGLDLTYVLDLAEIPTFQLLGPATGQPSLDRKTNEQAREWIANLALTEDGRKLPWHVKSIAATAADGAGGMPTLRIVIAAEAPLQPGKVAYHDLNFPGRAGWKEIVIDRTPGQSARDLSAA